MMKKLTLKDYLLLSTQVISLVHTFLKGNVTRVDWYLFLDYTRRIDYAFMYLENCINFLILGYCLMYPKGINIDVKRFVLIMIFLDMIHYFTFSKLYFAIPKIALGVLMFYLYKCYYNGKT